MIRTLAIHGYRSLREIVVPLHRLNVVTGANGTGKSSLYRSLRLLADAARNGAVAALAREGGLDSTLWAGPEHISAAMRTGDAAVTGTVRSKPISLGLGFTGDDFGYAIDLGLPIPVPGGSMFQRDPEIKRECVWAGPLLRPAALLADRSGTAVRLRDDAGSWRAWHDAIRPYDSMLSEIADPRNAPELLEMRERVRSWRFYDHVRTDAAAPARIAQTGTRTPVLAPDGSDLAAALQTIREIGDADALDVAVDAAFPGSRIDIEARSGRFDLALRQHGLLRPLAGAELSDGTLRYLLWAAVLLTPRPPELLVLNEPETSLHPDLLRPLSALIAQAASRSQVVVVSHARRLVDALTDADAYAIELIKDMGETVIADQAPLARPAWQWPKR